MLTGMKRAQPSAEEDWEWGAQRDFDPETQDGEPEVRLGGGRPPRAQTGQRMPPTLRGEARAWGAGCR